MNNIVKLSDLKLNSTLEKSFIDVSKEYYKYTERDLYKDIKKYFEVFEDSLSNIEFNIEDNKTDRNVLVYTNSKYEICLLYNIKSYMDIIKIMCNIFIDIKVNIDIDVERNIINIFSKNKNLLIINNYVIIFNESCNLLLGITKTMLNNNFNKNVLFNEYKVKINNNYKSPSIDYNLLLSKANRVNNKLVNKAYKQFEDIKDIKEEDDGGSLETKSNNILLNWYDEVENIDKHNNLNSIPNIYVNSKNKIIDMSDEEFDIISKETINYNLKYILYNTIANNKKFNLLHKKGS